MRDSTSAKVDWRPSTHAVLSVGAVVAWQVYLRKNPPRSDEPTLNRRGAQYIGRTFALSEAIDNGVGKDKWQDGVFLAPHGAAFDRNGDLYVLDWNRHGRVSRLRRVAADGR